MLSENRSLKPVFLFLTMEIKLWPCLGYNLTWKNRDYVCLAWYFLMDVLVQQLKSISFQSLGVIIAACPALVLLGSCLPGWYQLCWFAFSVFLLLLPSYYLLPWPLFLLPSLFPLLLQSPLLLTLPSFSPPLASSSLLLSVCVSKGSAPITSYLERRSCSQSGFCLLLGQVISELQWDALNLSCCSSEPVRWLSESAAAGRDRERRGGREKELEGLPA